MWWGGTRVCKTLGTRVPVRETERGRARERERQREMLMGISWCTMVPFIFAMLRM